MPSPPMPDASGSTTPSVNETATAASTTLPPRSSIARSRLRRERVARHDDRRDSSAPAGRTSGCSASIASTIASSAGFVARGFGLRPIGRRAARASARRRDRRGNTTRLSESHTRSKAGSSRAPRAGTRATSGASPASGGSGAAMKRAANGRPSAKSGIALAMVAQRLAVVGEIAIRRIGDQQRRAVGRPGDLSAVARHEHRPDCGRRCVVGRVCRAWDRWS